MLQEDYIYTHKWFAWKPVKTECGKWVWLKTINRTVDERDEVYLGLLPTYHYSL